MKEIKIFSFIVLCTTFSFLNAKNNIEETKQRMRLLFAQDPKHSVHKFHPNMINYWIITGEIKATGSIPLSKDQLEEQVKSISASTNNVDVKAQKTIKALSYLNKVQREINELRACFNLKLKQLQQYLTSK